MFEKIETLAFGGNGVVRDQNGLVIFVPFSAPDDLVSLSIKKQKKNYATGRIETLHTAGPARVAPRCPLFTQCGGCQFQHLHYEQQLLSKKQFIEDALKRIAFLEIDIPPVVPSPSPWAYRKHIRLNLQIKEQGGFEAGYIAEHFLPVSECLLFHEEGDPLLSTLQDHLGKLSHKGIKEGSLRIFKTEEKPLLAFSFFPYLPENRRAIFENSPFAVVMQSPRQKEEFGKVNTRFKIEGLEFVYSPYSFLQNNLEQSAHLYRSLLSLTSSSTFLDLYCGIGISSLLFAKQGKTVYGIESSKNAIALAKQNAAQNGLSSSVEFLCAPIEACDLKHYQASCVLVNPPRTGLTSAALLKLLELLPQEILYVSCMPPILARDLKVFLNSGYRLEYIQAFDMFPQTTHVETVVKLVRTHPRHDDHG